MCAVSSVDFLELIKELEEMKNVRQQFHRRNLVITAEELSGNRFVRIL